MAGQKQAQEQGQRYEDAGVSIEAGEELVDRIRPLAARTRIPEVLSGVGGFAGLCRVPSGMKEPVLVSGADGVGTKLKVAFLADRHDTVGIDLVAMCVNDVITTGARPLFFLDYFATGRLEVDKAEAVIRGIARGCELAGCALLGGETAEMPGFYADGEYDLSGFAVGVAERAALLDGPSRCRAGDKVIALPSTGLHSNGFSLARKVLLDDAELPLEEDPGGLGEALAEALLRPTRIYAKATAALGSALEGGALRALCHVTGGGMVGNLPRVLPVDLVAELDPSRMPTPQPIFGLIARLGGVDEAEMRRVFNMGTGMAVVVAPEATELALATLHEAGEEGAVEVGALRQRRGEEAQVSL
jgi:phosphoribosylformylglycinamidine cyclo-ligase